MRLRSLTAKFIFISILMLTFISVFATASYNFTHHLKGEATRINLAGSQRMLMINMALYTKSLLSYPDMLQDIMYTKRLEGLMSEYEETLYNLKDGSQRLGLKPMPKHNRESTNQLNALIELWSKTQKPTIAAVKGLPQERGNEACGMCHLAIKENMGKINAFVKSLEWHYDKELRDFDALRLYVLGFFGIAIVLSIILVRHTILKPVWGLINAAREIEKGNFDVRAETKSKDEVGELALSINHMASALDISFKAISKQKDELEYLFNTLDEVFSSLDTANHRQLQISPAVERLYGLPQKAFMDNPDIWKKVIHPDDAAIVVDKIAPELSKGNPVNVEYRIIRHDGEVRWVEVSIKPTLDKSGALVRLDSITSDTTKRKSLEEQLRQYAENLEDIVKERTKELEGARVLAEAANKAKSEFLTNMSHELRTPLNSIMGFAQVIKDGMTGSITDEQREYLKDILESGEHLLGLINDILDLAKIEVGKIEFEPAKFNILELVEESLSMFKEKTARQNIKVLSETEGIENITADRKKLKQVLVNLLGNAIKFTPDGGEIGIKIKRVEGGALFAVWDTGVGISEEDQKRLFQPFQQIESPLTKKHAGTGLGLNISRMLVELHGGRIWVESEHEKGSKFIFTIPIRQ